MQVGGKHEQKNDTQMTEVISVSKHNVEEIPEDGLKVGEYVLLTKKTDHNFVNTLRNFVEPDKQLGM